MQPTRQRRSRAVAAALVASAFAAAAMACGSFAPGDPARVDEAGDASRTDGAEIDGAGTDAAETCPGALACDRYVFVTSGTFDGAFNGIAKADEICQTTAKNGNSPVKGRTFKAWLSTTDMPVTDRLQHGTKRYLLPDGTLIAEGWQALLTDRLQHVIDVDENKAVVGIISGTFVWSGMRSTGQPSGEDCTKWTTNLTAKGDVGNLKAAVATRWFFNNESIACGTQARLYCFEE